METDFEREKKFPESVETDNEDGSEICNRDIDSHVSAEGRETSGFNIESNVEREFNGNHDPDGIPMEYENSLLHKEPLCVDHLERLHEEMLNPHGNHVMIAENQEDESLFVCKHSQCGFSTTEVEEYLRHEHEHTDGKVYQCDVCHTKFNQFVAMRRHRMMHLTHRPYDCRLCSKAFFRKDCLLEHLVKQHSKQRPYHCPFCVRHFKLRPLLKIHLSNEHSAATLIKTCKLCGFKAISPNSSRSHFAVCYYKKSREMMPKKGFDLSPMHMASEVNAIDLGAISQNFSFAPAHFTPFTVVSGENTHPVAGPSEVVPEAPLHTTTPALLTFNTEKYVREQGPVNETATISPVTSSASSTTVVSPSTNSSEGPQNLVMTNIRVLVKSEPSEPVDDSQNGCALPTSTMDLSTANVVETSYNSNDATSQQTSPDLPIKLKASCSSQKSEKCKIMPQPVEKPHVGVKRGFYTLSKVKCSGTPKESSCHCCSSEPGHVQHWKKRESSHVVSQSSKLCDRSHLNCIESCPSQHRETQTDMPSESHYNSDTFNNHTSCHTHQNFNHVRTGNQNNTTDSKNHIVIQKAEKEMFSCPYCEIMFPDQTLYFLHRSLHSETHPWKCNLCGKIFNDRYDFNSHIIGQGHH